MDLSNEQWKLLEPLIPSPLDRADRRGRSRKDPRDVLNGILWILRTGAPWHDLPGRYPSYSTCFRRFEQWGEDGTLKRILTVLYDDLRERGGIDDIEAFIDGSYVAAKKGDRVSESVVPATRQR